MSGKTILILGAGIGGLVAAGELRRLLPREHRVVLVEKNARHAFAPSFLWLMTGDRRPEQISCEVRQLVRPGVEVMLAEVRRTGLARVSGDLLSGINAISAPVFDHRRRVVLALTVLGDESRFDCFRNGPIVRAVQETALEVSRRLGYRDNGEPAA